MPRIPIRKYACLSALALGAVGSLGIGIEHPIDEALVSTRRLLRHTRVILPVYASFTGLLMLALILAAVCAGLWIQDIRG